MVAPTSLEDVIVEVDEDDGVAVVASVVEIAVLVTTDVVFPRKTAAASPSSLSVASRRLPCGQDPLAHGFCVQQPMKGGEFIAQIYHKATSSSLLLRRLSPLLLAIPLASFEAQLCEGISWYLSSSKEEGLSLSDGQELLIALQGLTVQQPRNWTAESLQT